MDLVEEVRHRPIEEQFELREILDHNLIALRQEEIYQNHLASLEEVKNGSLTFTSDVEELIRQVTETEERSLSPRVQDFFGR